MRQLCTDLHKKVTSSTDKTDDLWWKSQTITEAKTGWPENSWIATSEAKHKEAAQKQLTLSQISLAASENLSVYFGSSLRTRFSTSSREIFSLGARNGPCNKYKMNKLGTAGSSDGAIFGTQAGTQTICSGKRTQMNTIHGVCYWHCLAILLTNQPWAISWLNTIDPKVHSMTRQLFDCFKCVSSMKCHRDRNVGNKSSDSPWKTKECFHSLTVPAHIS